MQDKHQTPLSRAVRAWRELLGEDAARDDAKTLSRYARTLSVDGTRPCCVVYPSSTEEVCAIVRIAAREGQALYPISRGRNWGYGERCAPSDNAAILDLSGMNRIHEINGELGYAVIEPGVSQGQLYEAVRAQAPGFRVDCTGAGPEASIVGNALERGFGHTPYGDHVRTSCALEVVLADGQVLHTGYGRFPHSQAHHIYPYGLGPSLDGLFFQSNLGIVTRMTVWLPPAPQAFRAFFLRMEGNQVGELLDRLRPLRLQGILNSALHIANDLRTISSFERYPWEAAGGITPLPDNLRLDMRRRYGMGAWNGSGSISGTPGQVRDGVRQLKRALRGLARATVVGDRGLALRQGAVRVLQRFGLGGVQARVLEIGAPNYKLLQGEPTEAPLGAALWRVRKQDQPKDLLDTDAGLIWLAPVLPLDGAHAQRLLDAVEPIFTRHRFELPVTFTMLNERAMVAVMNIAFDRSVPDETAAAKACYEEALEAAMTCGYIPYRLGVGSMAHAAGGESAYIETLRGIKAALDPGGIIAPGRYIPR